MKSYYPLLDILRFFAAFWVMSFHYFLGLSGGLSWYRYGNLGVPLFFIISGFVISQSVARVSTKAFALGRFIRLFPLFWAAVTFTYIFTLLMPNGNPVHFQEYLISMSMLGDKFGQLLGYPLLVDAVYWSLTVELLFYVAIGAFVHFFKWDRIRIFTALWFAVAVLSFIIHKDQTLLAKTLLVRHASYFLFGITLMLIMSSEYKKIGTKLYDYAFLISTALFGTFISYRALPPYFVPHPLDTLNVTILQAVFFAGTALLVYFSRFVTSKKMVKACTVIGGITYPLYLLHQTIGNTLINYLAGGTAPLIAIKISMMVGMILFAYVVYLYDKRVRKYLTSKLLPSKEAAKPTTQSFVY